MNDEKDISLGSRTAQWPGRRVDYCPWEGLRHDEFCAKASRGTREFVDFSLLEHSAPLTLTSVIYRYAGRDATREYSAVHAPSLIETELEERYHVGLVDESTITDDWCSSMPTGSSARPPLSRVINLYDFEHAARASLSPKPWAYISGGSNDSITRDANEAFLKRIWLRPRILHNVGAVTTRTTLFGCPLSMPVYIAPTGAARMGGQEGELALARGAAAAGIVHCFSTLSSYPYAEVLRATPRHAFFQLYVVRERAQSEAALRQVEASGKVRAVLVTADLPVVSKREADERLRVNAPDVNANTGIAVGGSDARGGGFARQAGAIIDPTFNWDDLAWLRSVTKLPIVIKGVQRWEDARRAMQMGVQGIVVGNHGGRAADGAPPAILTLLELQRNCPEVFSAMEVLVDGGFRRGSDVVKAICLGASAVGFGRPFVYSINYGQEGVEHAAGSKSFVVSNTFAC